MATKDFEIQQLLKAYRKGLISDDLFAAQMKELGAAQDGLDVANVLALRGDASKTSAQMLQKTPQSQTMAFTIPANFSNDHENSHKGDQIIYVIEGCAIARVSGKEQEIKAGDMLMIPAGAPHTLRTESQPLFGVTIFAPPEA
ncbi:MAG: cupin domain-containing protein [Deltaproteobacteria bacterium]|nr:cupin domain-containing protein [Deltaproteobacteria bacterium]